MCVASKGRSDHYHREAPQPIDGDIARIKMDFMFVGAEGTFVDEPRAKATVLMVICKDDGNLSATEVRSKTDEYGVEMVIRFLSTYESVEIKTDGEPSIVEVARRVQARRDKMTTLAQTSVGGHQEIGTVERANGTVQAQLRAYFLDVQNRMKVRIIPGTLLFPWMLRHSVWTVVRYQSDQRTKQTPYERTRGCRYESALVPFGEVVMAKIADGDKMRAGKLDSAWVKAVWVGRVDRSNEHLLLTTKGCIKSRVVRRIPDGNQASFHAEVQGLSWDTLKGSAEMLRNALVRPGEPPRPSRGRPRKDGSPAQARTATTLGHATRDDPMPGSSDDHLRQTATETDVIEQDIVMDSGAARTSESIVMASGTARTSENIVMGSGTARTSDSIVMGSENARASDGRADQGVLRMDQEEGISAEEQARRRLRSKQPDRRPDEETVSKRMKRETTIAAIKQKILKTVEERLDLEQAHNFYSSIRTLRSPESIHASRMVEINKWRERGVIERWSRQAAMATGGQFFNARWVDEQHKEKSRYVVKDFANTRDPTMFAAASDTAVGRVVEFKAVIQNYSMFTFDVTSAYTHAWEDELVFLEPPPEEIEEHGDCVWRSIRVIYGRRKGARSWQEHFDSILRGEEARQRGLTVEAHPKCPTLYYVREADGVIELHVDDGHGCGKDTVIAELLSLLSEKIEMKWVQGIKCGSCEYLKPVKVREGKKLTSIPNKKHLQSALKKLEMSDCKGSVSPKLDKSCIEGDSEELSEELATRFRSAVLTLLYLSNERTDIQSTVRLLCTKLKSPTALEMRQLKRLLRYVKSTEDMSTVFEMRDDKDRSGQTVKRLEVYTDSDWASDQVTRKSTSGAVIMAEGMRLHAHSRGQASVALSSCEAEVMAASEGIKEALLLQEVLMFVGLGHSEIEIKVDSRAAHAFFHRRGVGRMKHIDSRILWLQDLIAAGGVRLKKISRTQNLADMLTHTPSAKELEMFLPLMSLRRCSERDKEMMTSRRYKPVPVENLKVYSHG